jgi:hypothetical protein
MVITNRRVVIDNTFGTIFATHSFIYSIHSFIIYCINFELNLEEKANYYLILY